MNHRVDQIKTRLQEALSPSHLEIIDDSAAHAGHSGVQASGGGHFSALIVADAFAGKSLVQRHQMVYRALGELMQTDIHALSMRVLTPTESQNQGIL